MANKWAESDIGKINLDSDKFNKLFKVKNYELNTQSVANHIKLFREKIGLDIDLQVDIAI